jgi:hypothetical protein
MGLKSALRENRMRVIPFALLLVLGWIALGIVDVWNTMDGFRAFVGVFRGTAPLGPTAASNPAGEYVGHAATSGYVGLGVLLVTLLAGLYLYAATGETTPAPERFPPR